MFENTVIIPYRNRPDQLEYFIENSWKKVLYPALKNAQLLIVEQSDDGQLFNRGKLLNCGIQESQSYTKYFIVNDVDVNPKKTILPLYTKNVERNTFLSIYGSPFITLGGIIKFQGQDFLDINGFPNDIWGWGNEDRALYNRAKFYNKSVNFSFFSNSQLKDRYFEIFDTYKRSCADGNTVKQLTHYQYNVFHTLSHPEKKTEVLRSGLNTLEYSVLDRKQTPYNVQYLTIRL